MRSLLIALLFMLSMCSTNTEVYQSHFHRNYQNGRSIEVTREDKVTRWTGLITGTNYGTTNTYIYHFNIEPDDYEWEGLINQAPRALVFCANDVYMRVTEQLYKLDSLGGGGHYKDTTLYFKNKDERYFFKLFGDQSFVDSDSIAYEASKIKCKEVPIPIM